MSIIFGTLLSHGVLASQDLLLKMARCTERFANDGLALRSAGNLGMGIQPFHSNERSYLEREARIDDQSNMVTFDGRLDNYAELMQELQLVDKEASDSVIVLAAFRRWREECFAHFIGDWALALWAATEQTLYLARDHAGSRSLYYKNLNGHIEWSTYIETLLSGTPAAPLDDRYIGSYLGCQMIRDLTPFKDVLSVSPGHYLASRDGHVVKRQHWACPASVDLRYEMDGAYEEQFLYLLDRSVARRSGAGAPTIAELSGGMDSSAIVCVSDRRRSLDNCVDLLDTVSYYDDSEPNWNEQDFFSVVEEKRGKRGIHIQASLVKPTFEPFDASQCNYTFPGPDSSAVELENLFGSPLTARGYKSILSGVGGDEVLGGVPTPSPELADYLVTGRFGSLLEKTFQWCLVDRTPLIEMFLDTARFALSLYGRSTADAKLMPPWIRPHLREACMDLAVSSHTFQERIRRAPSALSNELTWWSILDSLPHLSPAATTRREYRYPYLDRDLVEFLFRVPREQLVRPGRRRSLMRRALKGIVPVEILERRRKAFVIRGPLTELLNAQEKIRLLFRNPLIAQHGFVDLDALHSCLEVTLTGSSLRWLQGLTNAIHMELWLLSHADQRSLVTMVPALSRVSTALLSGPTASTRRASIARAG
jgi:asparagine synthase (glutamine-hydrolysing)